METIFGEDAVFDVYDMNDILVKRDFTQSELKQLSPGIYILSKSNSISPFINYH